MARRRRRGWLWALLLGGGQVAMAQVAPDRSVAEALRSLETKSAVAFAGEVTGVRRNGGVVEVAFRVDEALKGQVGATYVLREWAGLWAAGVERYHLGERAVVFFHPATSGGLSSPVDGMEGVLPLVADATAPGMSVDVERLRARVGRAAGAEMTQVDGRMSLVALQAVLRADDSAKPPVRGPLPIAVVRDDPEEPRPLPGPFPVRRGSGPMTSPGTE